MPKNTLFSRIITSTVSMIHLIFGTFTWKIPPWINQLRISASTQPRKFFGFCLSVVLLIVGIFFFYLWYQTLPQAERVIAKINPPKLTPIDKVPIPNNLTIDFGVLSKS